MNKVDSAILKMAAEIGDPFGFSPETVDYIAGEFQISVDEVEEVLNNGVTE